MATTTTTPAKRGVGRPRNPNGYDPQFVVRVPQGVYDGLRQYAFSKGRRIADVVRENLTPYEWYTTTDGVNALNALEHAIGYSTTKHTGPAEFGQHHTVTQWHGLTVSNFGTDEQPMFVHYVFQREGVTRADAVQQYARMVWGALATLSEPDRTSELERVTDDTQHAFVLALKGIRTWTVFPSRVEFDQWLQLMGADDGVAPTTDDERVVYERAVVWFNELLVDVSTNKPTPFAGNIHTDNDGNIATPEPGDEYNVDRPGKWVLHSPEPTLVVETDDDGHQFDAYIDNARWWWNLRWYPDEHPDDGIQRWARQMVKRYREWVQAMNANPSLFGTGTPEQFMVEARNDGYTVTTLRWLNEPKRKKQVTRKDT